MTLVGTKGGPDKVLSKTVQRGSLQYVTSLLSPPSPSERGSVLVSDVRLEDTEDLGSGGVPG